MSRLSEEDVVMLSSHIADILEVECNEIQCGYDVGHDLELHFAIKDSKEPVELDDLAATVCEYVILKAEIMGYSDLINYQVSMTEEFDYIMIFLRYLDRNK